MSAQSSPLLANNRLQQHLSHLKAQGKKALVIYLMAGDPSIAFTESIVPDLAKAGVDLVELGYPFSDPVADGPVIQAAAMRALPNWNGLDAFWQSVRRIRKVEPNLPLVLMTYYNLIFRYGESATLQAARQNGIDGLIIPDLPAVEHMGWASQCAEAGICAIPLTAPNTPEARLPLITKTASGFVYMVSLKGITGASTGLGEQLSERADYLRAHTNLPLLVGFGISTPQQAKAMATIADGVVIGSSAVQCITDAATPQQAKQALLQYVEQLRKAID